MKYLKLFNESKQDLIIEVLDWNYVEIEDINENYIYKNRGKKVPLTEEQQERLRTINRIINNYLKNINDFEGKWNGKIIPMEIELTKHYITKFIRREMEGNDYENPGLHEGIDVIYNNRNLLAKYLSVGVIKNGQEVLVKMKISNNYEVLVIIRKNDDKYIFRLKSQMKGRGKSYSKGKQEHDKDIKLHPNGPLPSQLSV